MAGPSGAAVVAESFSVLDVVLAAVNEAVTPEGKPPTVKVGVPVKPFRGVTVTVLEADAPCVTIKLAGAVANVKLGAAFTARLSVAELDVVPEVPIAVTEVAPTAAADVALNVATLVVEVAAGLKETVTPLGRAEVVRVTLPAKPFLGVTVTVLVALAP